MFKNAYFLEKAVKNRLSVGALPPITRLPLVAGGSALRLPRCYFRLLLQFCRVHF